MSTTLDLVISILTAASVLAVGLELELRDLRTLVKEKFLLAGLLTSQLILSPLLSIAITQIVPMPEDLKIDI